MRRQNRSCDQCRKAKRACDAPSLRETIRRSASIGPSRSDAVLSEALDAVCVPCSYCVRTNKQCTLNWARSQLQVAEAALAARPGGPRRPKRPRAGSSADIQQPPYVHVSPVVTESTSSSSIRLWGEHQQQNQQQNENQSQNQNPHQNQHQHPSQAFAGLDAFSGFPDTCNYIDDADLASVGLAHGSGDCSENASALVHLPHADMPIHIPTVPHQQAFDAMSPDHASLWAMMPPPTDQDRSNPALIGLPSPNVCASAMFSPVSVPPSPSMSGTADTQYSTSRSVFSQQKYGVPTRRGSRRPSVFSSSLVAFSPSSLEQHLAARSNSQNISENLLQIYHDVLEHNFSCWVTEATCPYRVWNCQMPTTDANSMPSYLRLQRPPPKEMGTQWSNRIYHRVSRLDQMARAARLIHVTREQAQASQKALNLVIMAFATQWAQGSRRQRETYSVDFSDRPGVPGMPGAPGTPQATGLPAEEFDRNLQRMLWEQARQALQDCAEVESYSMVCAELIFSMVQRPWEADTLIPGLQNESGSASTDEAGQMVLPDMLSTLADILAKEGPPIFAERAARKIHSLKYHFDCHEARRKQQIDDRSASSSSAQPTPPSEESDTVRLLYWLAVMVDTIHASVHERPVVLGDEESQHDAAALEDEHKLPVREPALSADRSLVLPLRPAAKPSDRRWRIHLFLQDDPGRDTPLPQQQWPCPYEDVGLTIARSAPVKVLLYRYVHYLQKSLRHGYSSTGGAATSAAAAAAEDTIHDTLLVYRYWNVTYGPFYRDMIANYASVPPRIRGWSVCIIAHWHLGALLFADILEDVDARRCGLDAARARRRAAGTVASIRRLSALQLSDLARMATPNSFDAPAGFDASVTSLHFAVREGTILSEPWTILLIHAFSKAAVLHLQDAEEMRQLQHQNPDAPDMADLMKRRDSLQRCEDCVQALWMLGKKSDMARSAAAVLSKALQA